MRKNFSECYVIYENNDNNYIVDVG